VVCRSIKKKKGAKKTLGGLEQHKEGKRNQKIPSWFVAIERGKKQKKPKGVCNNKKSKEKTRKISTIALKST
jgi:hypothetical protein